MNASPSSASEVLIYFTAKFPYGKGEQFVENEVIGLSKKFKTIYLVPFGGFEEENIRILPKNCTIVPKIRANHPASGLNTIIQLIRILTTEAFRSGKLFFILSKFRFFLSQLKQADELAAAIKAWQDEQDIPKQVHYYSSWMNEHALALALLKKSGQIPAFSFKMRGYDLFDERREGGYMPFRRFIFKGAKSILTMSSQGANYLKAKGICPDRIHYNYPGIESQGINQLQEGIFTLVSCSGIVDLKRVDSIAEAVISFQRPIRWIHFGHGPEREKIDAIVAKAPEHVTIELKGSVDYEEIISTYIHEKIDAFIHLSSTEGFGYAIIEAYSAGIPGILFPVDGVKELIGPERAVAVQTPFSIENVHLAIDQFQSTFYGKQAPKDACLEFYRENFDIEKKANELYDYITDSSLK